MKPVDKTMIPGVLLYGTYIPVYTGCGPTSVTRFRAATPTCCLEVGFFFSPQQREQKAMWQVWRPGPVLLLRARVWHEWAGSACTEVLSLEASQLAALAGCWRWPGFRPPCHLQQAQLTSFTLKAICFNVRRTRGAKLLPEKRLYLTWLLILPAMLTLLTLT